MHSAQASTTSITSDSNCTLDIKPTIQSSGQQQQSAPKQREGTSANNNSTNNSLNSSNQNNQTTLNGGGLFDTTPHQNGGQNNNNNGTSVGSGSVGGNNGLYNGYDTSSYGYHQSSGPFQTTGRPSISPHVKPQRTKARTSAGKTFRHGVGLLFV